MTNLPSTWRLIPLQDVCDINPRDAAPEDLSTEVSFIPMPAVSDVKGVILPHETRPFSEVSRGYTRFRDGDVIFAKITPCMENGKIAVASGLTNGVACGSTEFHVCRTKPELLPEFLWRFLRQKTFRQDAERRMTGAVGQRRVPAQFLKETLIPLPPVSEQHDILAKLKALFARSNDSQTDLDRIPRLIERYKQAVVASAFSRRMTIDWRATNRISLDNDWESLSLGDVAVDVRYGTAAKCAYEPVATPVLRIPNVADGRIDTSDLKYARFTDREIAKLALKEGDLLIIRSNGSLDLVGRTALVTQAVEGFLFAGYLIRMRFDRTRVEPRFAQMAFEELSSRRAIEAMAKSTSGVNNINSEQLKALKIPVPPLAEQQEIVRLVSEAFARIDTAAHESSKAARLLERLEEVTLTKAFSGELLTSSRDATNDNQLTAKPSRWVFGYGSLMWDGWETAFGGKRVDGANLVGYRRAFNKKSVKNWGSSKAPGPTLGLEPADGTACAGTVFEFAPAQLEPVKAHLTNREGKSFSLIELPVRLPDGREVLALTPVNDRQHNTYIGSVPVAARAEMARNAHGTSGACADYARNIQKKLVELNIEDPDVVEFLSLVERPVAGDPAKKAG
jgi:type I restriction enzyme S subunit